MDKTGVDLPGEAGTITHKKENVGLVELATMTFGQSFQITPIQMATTVSSLINGGRRVTPHFGVKVINEQEKHEKIFEYKERKKCGVRRDIGDDADDIRKRRVGRFRKECLY